MNDIIEQKARDAIVEIAYKNGLYFVVWSGHFGRYLHALKNRSGKFHDIYSAIYDSYYDLVGSKDDVVFKFNLPEKFTWQDMLMAIKANLPIDKHHLER